MPQASISTTGMPAQMLFANSAGEGGGYEHRGVKRLTPYADGR